MEVVFLALLRRQLSLPASWPGHSKEAFALVVITLPPGFPSQIAIICIENGQANLLSH
jgi:hypothetical protein